MVQYLFIICMALAAACGGNKRNDEEKADTLVQQQPEQEAGLAPEQAEDNSSAPFTQDTLYLVSGTEPFWSMVVAKPQIIFTSMEGDTLTFPYQEPERASGRSKEYLQVFKLDGEQQLIMKQTELCPCSDGMSDREYPYQVTLILNDRILEGCGRKSAPKG